MLSSSVEPGSVNLVCEPFGELKIMIVFAGQSKVLSPMPFSSRTH